MNGLKLVAAVFPFAVTGSTNIVPSISIAETANEPVLAVLISILLIVPEKLDTLDHPGVNAALPSSSSVVPLILIYLCPDPIPL